ncbi:hypothetical protein BB559_005947 [Furculomyces boomerangus]|uniref:ENTH domain-containing protein n=1 Tax=Furculomyces boomerangus TaxID=61424 RepID=A0A2T9Y5M8_9FUNG|nr:hypothetical protein BB559_005947 [Furculomyces boomerangus]
MGDAARNVLRSVKNYTKGYSDIQMTVRDATSNKATGPETQLLAEIANATFNPFGSEQVISYSKQNIYIVKTLKEFQYIDEAGYDRGLVVRQKAKDVTDLLMDPEKLRNLRISRSKSNSRQNSSYGNNSGGNKHHTWSGGSQSRPAPLETEEERNLRLAIEESKKEAAKSKIPSGYNESMALEMALQESAKEASMASSLIPPDSSARKSAGDLLVDLGGAWDDNINNNTNYNNQQLGQQGFATSSQGLMNPGVGYGNGMYDGGINTFGYSQASSSGMQPFGADALLGGNQNNTPFVGGFATQNLMENQNNANTFNPFGNTGAISNNLNQTPFSDFNSNSASNHPFSATGAFGNAFDSGSAAKPLPFGVDPNGPNARIAEIARNSNKIDPFANLATSSTTQTLSSNQNPFGTLNTSSVSGNSQPTINPGQVNDIFGMNLSQGSNLVDLSPSALSSNQNKGQAYQSNPFATISGVNSSAAASTVFSGSQYSNSGQTQMQYNSLQQPQLASNNIFSSTSNTQSPIQQNQPFATNTGSPFSAMAGNSANTNPNISNQQNAFSNQPFSTNAFGISGNAGASNTTQQGNNQNLFF